MELAKDIRKARRVYLCGNGGSAANAIHIANDLISCGIRAHALTADVATLTAIANDYSYEAVFSRQIQVFGEPGDLLIVLSGSGRSPNIVAALKAAAEVRMNTWAIVGIFNKSPPAAMYSRNFTAQGSNMQEAESIQIKLGHEAMRWLKRSAKVAA